MATMFSVLKWRPICRLFCTGFQSKVLSGREVGAWLLLAPATAEAEAPEPALNSELAEKMIEQVVPEDGLLCSATQS
eukprot:127985-Amphidinium_carterae.1